MLIIFLLLKRLLNAKKALMRLYQSIKDIPAQDDTLDEHWINQFTQAMNDDFNTPIALSVLFQFIEFWQSFVSYCFF